MFVVCLQDVLSATAQFKSRKKLYLNCDTVSKTHLRNVKRKVKTNVRNCKG